jgi:hypothetical protein
LQSISASIEASLPENTAAGQPPFPAQTGPLKVSVKNYMSYEIVVGSSDSNADSSFRNVVSDSKSLLTRFLSSNHPAFQIENDSSQSPA